MRKVTCSTTGEYCLTYTDYLNSKHWKMFRDKIIIERKGECERCFDVAKPAVIHHKTYKRLGKELPKDVSLLCKKCHGVVHSKREGRKEARKQVFESQMNKMKKEGLKPSALAQNIIKQLTNLEEPQLLKVLAYATSLEMDDPVDFIQVADVDPR